MRKLIIAAAVCCMALSAGAADVEAGNWIQLFDGETLYGWTAYGDVEWKAGDGAIIGADAWDGMLATTSRFKDFELEAEMRVQGEGTTGLTVRGNPELHPSAGGGKMLVLSAKDSTDWRKVNIKAVGGEVAATVDGEEAELVGEAADRGHVMLQYHRRHGQGAPQLTVRKLHLRPLGMQKLFNGKDLSGWSELPGHPSEFQVKEGAINIINGPGQLETEGQYDDMLLQLDIISNGEHLNSGVFFRGPKGVFWKGYESQVRNQWEGDNRGNPVDFGTGGVYGVQPARKVVPSDFEWFSKTVVADGNHIAIWIDGYQVSDFFDTRPVNEAGDSKVGFVPEAGTIHLQGHDPTTDLSFKNIHVQEYGG